MSFTLLKSIEGLLKPTFDTLPFRTAATDEAYANPQFFIGALPPRRADNNPATQDLGWFPFVVCRFTAGDDSEGFARFGVKTIFGIHTKEDVEGGEHDIANMVFTARRLILQAQAVDGFGLVFPLKWSFGEERDHHGQAHPQYVGCIDTVWSGCAIQRIISNEDQERVFSTGAPGNDNE